MPWTLEEKGSMQITLDPTLLSGLAASVLSSILAIYLISLWYRQDNRLLTDLPLMFGVVFIAHAMNQSMLLLSDASHLQMTLDVFRVRALIVGGIALPLVGVLLHIWLPKIRRHHMRIMGFVAAYWIFAALFGPSQELIMLFHLPVIITFMGGMIVTFLVTWRTGRLKEVRSDLMVFSTILSLAGQLTLIPLTAAGLGIISGVIMVMATLFATLALSNPWYKREQVVF